MLPAAQRHQPAKLGWMISRGQCYGWTFTFKGSLASSKHPAGSRIRSCHCLCSALTHDVTGGFYDGGIGSYRLFSIFMSLINSYNLFIFFLISIHAFISNFSSLSFTFNASSFIFFACANLFLISKIFFV